MGRLLTAVLGSMNKGIYLDHMSHWYTREGEQTFGLRFINFLHENLGTQFLQGFDKLVVYRLVSELRAFYRDYSITLGGGSMPPELQAKHRLPEYTQLINMLRGFDQHIKGNFEGLSSEVLGSFTAIVRMIKPRLVSLILPRV